MDDQLQPPRKKQKQEPDEREEFKVNLNDLPVLPFEKILGYLSLEDRIRSRAVSRKWCQWIDSFKVKSLCCSDRPGGFIIQKNRWLNGAFAGNFIGSSKFRSFLDTFSQSILSDLNHLRLCDLRLNVENRKALAQILNSFDRLQKLCMVRFTVSAGHHRQKIRLKLYLPMLTTLRIENVAGIKNLTLNAPRLQLIEHWTTALRLELIHGESVEKVVTESLKRISIQNLKNLKYLYCKNDPTDSTFLANMKQLKELHLDNYKHVSRLFEQKQLTGPPGLKIYKCGLLLNDSNDPLLRLDLRSSNTKIFNILAMNDLRLADEIPVFKWIRYSAYSRVAPGLEMSVLNRFVNLCKIKVDRHVRDVDRFLNILNDLGQITNLHFTCGQPQDLYDRLPQHCAVQQLTIQHPVRLRKPNLGFLFRLEHLIRLEINCPMGTDLIRRALLELEFLSYFNFLFGSSTNNWRNLNVAIRIDPTNKTREFDVLINKVQKTHSSDLDAVLQFVVEEDRKQRLKFSPGSY